MPRKARVKSRSGIYHIMIRGANKQVIFHDEEDNVKFLEVLLKYKQHSGMKVYGWCLMGNHAHLLLREGEEGISATMKRIGVSYVHYYNRKYDTIGHLFQDRFRSEKVESRRYFLTVIRYIHQNPLKAGLVIRPEEWRWSSCGGYYNMDVYPPGLLDASVILSLFSQGSTYDRDSFREFNEKQNQDECLEDFPKKTMMPDSEAGKKIREVLGELEIAQVKSLSKAKRETTLRRVKELEGISQRQAARILGISPSLIFKA